MTSRPSLIYYKGMKKKKRKKIKPGSGRKLTAVKVEKLWQQFAAGISINSISRKLGVSHTTIAKYRDSEGWVKRRDKINKRAIKKSDTKTANKQADKLELVNIAINKLATQIIDAKELGTGKSKTPYSDLDKMVRLDLLLRGLPDSNPAQPKPQEELARMSVEQLIIIHNDIISGNGHKRKRIKSKVKPGGNGDGHD